ncbi:MAG: hypothetical protein LUP99_02850 [Methanomicrobiales archaeon]|nr:hypothetical protein [Methanomicrobiales archaeon]
MRPYKRIERCIARYIAKKYRKVVEVGVGENFGTAEELVRSGCIVICTDVRISPYFPPELNVQKDDIFRPVRKIYEGADLLYAIRPGVEMVPPLISLAKQINADLLVYHLGDELFEGGGRVIECGVPLHQYYSRKEETIPLQSANKI